MRDASLVIFRPAHGGGGTQWEQTAVGELCVYGRTGILSLQSSQKPLGSTAPTSQMCKRLAAAVDSWKNTPEPSRRI